MRRTSKRFLYEGRRERGDSLKASLDTRRNGPTFFHTIAPASQIALVMHNVFTGKEKKKHNRAEIWCIVLSQCLEGVPFYGEILQDFDIIFHNKIKSALQLQAEKTLTEICQQRAKKLLIKQLNIIMQKSTLWSFYRLFFLQRCGSKCSHNNLSNLVFFEKTHANSWLQELPQFYWLSNSFYKRPSQKKIKKKIESCWIQAEEK